MSDSHAERLYRRLVDGGTLTRDDVRHIRTCVACQRAVADADRLDDRLRDAAASLAREPIPAETIDVAPMRPGWMDRFGRAPLGVAAAVAALIVAAGMAASGAFPVAERATPSPAASASVDAAPMQSPAHTPAATPPAVTETDPYVVGPLAECADGDAGFSFVLPEGWYANRRMGDAPACRTAAPRRPGQTGLPPDPAVTFSVVPAPPALEGDAIVSRDRIELTNGIVLERLVIHRPESGALAAESTLTYVAPLLPPADGGPGGYLVAVTDPNNAERVAGLDRIMQRLELRPSLAASPEAVAEAESLFHDRDVCLDGERGLGVVFPDAWWTNTAVDEAPACSYFSSGFFEIGEAGTVPDGVEVSMSLVVGDDGPSSEIVGLETVTLLDRPATRWELANAGGRVYQYVVQLGETAEAGPNLVASTHVLETGQYELAKAVLDGMMERIGNASPPPGASASNPPIEDDPVTATDSAGDFRLDFTVEQDRYRAGQPILADAVLTYLGDEPTLDVWASGTGLIQFSLRQLDGPLDPGGAATTDCVRYEISPERPMWVEFAKSGSFSEGDPNAALYEAYFTDHLLRLPPGRYEVTAGAGGTIGDDCGAGEPVSLETRVEITVEP